MLRLRRVSSMLATLTDYFLCTDANLFKDAFLQAQKDNEALFNSESAATEAAPATEAVEEKKEETKTEEPSASS